MAVSISQWRLHFYKVFFTHDDTQFRKSAMLAWQSVNVHASLSSGQRPGILAPNSGIWDRYVFTTLQDPYPSKQYIGIMGSGPSKEAVKICIIVSFLLLIQIGNF